MHKSKFMDGTKYSDWIGNNPKESQGELAYRLGYIQNILHQMFQETRKKT